MHKRRPAAPFSVDADCRPIPFDGMLTPWDAILPSEQHLTCSRPRLLQRRPPQRATTESEPQRHVLPKNLPNAIKHLSDGELDFLHATTLEELKRRGRTPQGVETDLQSLRYRFAVRAELPKQSPPTKKRQHVDVAEAPRLTQGKLNAVRAAFKAGVTPSRIAKQFGISQSDVRQALASNEKRR